MDQLPQLYRTPPEDATHQKSSLPLTAVCGNMSANMIFAQSSICGYTKYITAKLMLKQWIIFGLLAITIAVSTPSVSASHAAAPQQSGAEVISAINGYRAAYGLASLSTNALLTSLAQGQADYQASISTVTHTGPGGSTARDRALAAGYNMIYLSEIIYGGWNATVADALTWWQNSSLHNSIMLQSKYTEIGAGVAVSGDTVYYTAVIATPSGSSGAVVLPTTSSGEPSTGEFPTSEPVTVVMPVQLATPQADGAIIHVVQEGQTIWTIEAVYGLEPGTLQKLNEIESYPYVFPGDELVIRPAGSIDAEDAPTDAEESPSPTSSYEKPSIGTAFSYTDPNQVTPTPPVVITKPAHTTAPVVSDNTSQSGFLQGNSTAKTIVIAALIVLIVVMIGSMFLQKPPEKPSGPSD